MSLSFLEIKGTSLPFNYLNAYGRDLCASYV